MSNRPEDSRAPRNPASDIVRDAGIAAQAPAALHPYVLLLRLDRPIGTWLLLLPCWWGLALAVTGATPPVLGLPVLGLWYGLLFGVGAVVMRGAGCIVNDIYDRDFDAAVARTADRPIASGAVSVRRALLVLAGLLLLGLLILAQFNPFTVGLGAASLALVFTYPLMKRVTHWPQIVLGLAFNWGALLGWTALRGGLDWPAAALYGAGIAWTLGYDTIYAHQDKEDDALLGLKSTALLFGRSSLAWIAGFYAATVALLALAGALVGLAWPFYAGLVLAALHLVRQVRRVDLDEPQSCLSAFKSNRDFGLIVTGALLAGHIS